MASGSGFQSQVAGYGFLALAVMIFGNWKPLNILGASLFFAFFKILGSYSSAIPFLPDFEGIKSSEYIYLMLPYVVTMYRAGADVQEVPRAEGRGHPLRQGQPLTAVAQSGPLEWSGAARFENA